MSETPIYDQLVRERWGTAMERMKESLIPLVDALKRLGLIASGGSSRQEVSAGPPSGHSLPDTSRPESSSYEDGDLERDMDKWLEGKRNDG